MEFEISPTVVDVSTNGQFITITARITDDLSGYGSEDPFIYSFGSVAFKAPGADASLPVVTAQLFPFFRVSGDVFDGVYSSQLFIPAHSRTGIWTVASLTLGDQVHNVTNLLASDLRGLGLPISFTVTGVEDRNPPEILSLTMEPATVDTSTTNATITITAHIREDVSLAGWFDAEGRFHSDPGWVQYVGPSKRQSVTAAFSAEQISGDDHEGVFRTTLNVLQYSEPGVWRLSNLRLKDFAGNIRTIDLATALSSGLAAEFTVTGQGDTSPPTLHAFDFFPRWIDLPTTNQTVTVVARFTDDLHGFVSSFDSVGRPIPSFTSVEFQSPSRRQIVPARLLPDAESESGPLDLNSTGTLDFLKFCETGVWTVLRVTLNDGLGNLAQFDAERLRRLGYPTEIAVGITPTIAISLQQNSILLSWPAWGISFHLESRDIDAASWTSIPAQPAQISDQLVISLPKSPASQLFRLAQ